MLALVVVAPYSGGLWSLAQVVWVRVAVVVEVEVCVMVSVDAGAVAVMVDPAAVCVTG